MRKFETGATRDTNTDKLDYRGFISPLAMRRFAEYMHKHRKQPDGSMRSSDNWKRGMPPEVYMESFIRHSFELWLAYEDAPRDLWEPKAGDDIEDVACAILFNIQGWLHERMKQKLVETVPEEQPEFDFSVKYAPEWPKAGNFGD